MSSITTYCHITSERCYLNGKLVVNYDPESTDGWMKQLYKISNLNYPKFYKMDTLSQAGYLASEFIKAGNSTRLSNYEDDQIATVFANKNSCADSDIRFRNSYEVHHTPSPAMFVYTLPNIVLGEIAIANKWYGENMFVVLPKFDPDFYIKYCDILLSSGSEAVLGGWLDVSEEETRVFLFLVENSIGVMEFSSDNLLEIAERALN